MDVVSLVARLLVIEPAVLERGEVEAALGSVAALQRWLDGLHTALVARLGALAVPEADQVVARATRSNARDARRAVRRAVRVKALPGAAELLDAGAIGADHVDAVGDALAALDAPTRAAVAAELDDVWEVARTSSPEATRAAVQARARAHDASGGMDELERQKRDVRLRMWTDKVSKMVCLSGRFDAATGLWLTGRLTTATEALFHGPPLPRCPIDPGEKQQFLMAHALLQLLDIPTDTPAPVDWTKPDLGMPPPRPRASARADVCIVIDERTDREGLHEGSIVDVGGPPGTELPVQVVRHWASSPTARRFRVHVDPRTGIVTQVEGGGPLDLGRSCRDPSPTQRRALRVIHPTCVVPGCDVPFSACHIHHVHWWEHGGPTDLASLVPVCHRDHHRIHDEGWVLVLHPDRSVTVIRPDGTSTTGPPPRTRRERPPPEVDP